MTGPKASGKTLTALAIALELLKEGTPCTFRYVMEPRADIVSDFFDKGGAAWEDYLTDACRSVKGEKGGVVIIDSITYLIARLPKLVALKEELSTATYQGGLSPRDIMGVLLHDNIARKEGVALIATLNSELFPTVDKLEGACEGQIILTSPGIFVHRDRTNRTTVTESVSVDAAANLLGYKADKANTDRT
jgi:hypothetical protein